MTLKDVRKKLEENNIYLLGREDFLAEQETWNELDKAKHIDPKDHNYFVHDDAGYFECFYTLDEIKEKFAEQLEELENA